MMATVTSKNAHHWPHHNNSNSNSNSNNDMMMDDGSPSVITLSNAAWPSLASTARQPKHLSHKTLDESHETSSSSATDETASLSSSSSVNSFGKEEVSTAALPPKRNGGKPKHTDRYSNSQNKCDATKPPRRRRRRRRRGGRRTQQTCDNDAMMLLPPPELCFALDCEMVGIASCTTAAQEESMVSRVTLINFDGDTVMDVTVFPEHPIIDYRSQVSGITAEYLAENATMTLQDCREQLEHILQLDTDSPCMLIGHGLKNDLRCLGIHNYPWHKMRDTTKYEPFLQFLPNCQRNGPRKLKALASQYLQISIQESGKPHSPYEDAWAALGLYKCMQYDWEKLMEYKIHKTNQMRDMKYELK